MNKNEVDAILEPLFRQVQMQFGSAIKGRWFYDGGNCPGCGKAIGTMRYKQKSALSLNAFIYREHGVLIAYLLCGKCGNQVIRAKEELPLHAVIEKNLKSAFVKQLGH